VFLLTRYQHYSQFAVYHDYCFVTQILGASKLALRAKHWKH